MSRSNAGSSVMDMRRDESGNRRMWASEHDLYLRRLREWRRAVRKMARKSVKVVREKMRSIATALLTVKATKMNWWYKMYKSMLEPAVLVFIGLIMGHWTLFFAYGLAMLASWGVVCQGKKAYARRGLLLML